MATIDSRVLAGLRAAQAADDRLSKSMASADPASPDFLARLDDAIAAVRDIDRALSGLRPVVAMLNGQRRAMTGDPRGRG